MKAAEHRPAAITRQGLGQLISSLQGRGYEVIGPRARDGAIVYDTLHQVEDLPAGWVEEQEAGRYRLRKAEGSGLFGYTVGPHSWKRYLHPAEVRLFEARKDGADFHILNDREPPPPRAFLGVRACELAAIGIQDRVLTEDRFLDPIYQSRRRRVFIVAVNCTRAAPTCFCASLQTGPRAREGFDLALTEVVEHGESLFLVEAGSEAGAEVVRELESREASPALCRRADEAVEQASSQLRRIDTAGLREAIAASFDHPRWDQVAGRCLGCANCTMVCPTCFCTTVEDASDVTGEHAERWRPWRSVGTWYMWRALEH